MADGAGLLDGAEAPFHRQLAQGPADAEARWLTAGDGVRLRAVRWAREARRGTVLIFSGRTEYAEKYGRVAWDLGAKGFGTLTVDWRGQGLSDRLRPDRATGHVGHWGDYQLDVAALVAHGRALDLPEPWFLLAHSMGGAIGLRALQEGLPVAAAAFSAPMWGLQVAAAFKPGAWPVARGQGLASLLAPSAEPQTYVMQADFAENLLTGDRETWEWLRSHVAAEPELALGAPSLHWLNEALREMRRLMGERAPEVPALGIIGSEEAIVDPARLRARLADWPGARLVTLPGGRHEVLMDVPSVRSRALAEVVAHFGGQGEV